MAKGPEQLAEDARYLDAVERNVDAEISRRFRPESAAEPIRVDLPPSCANDYAKRELARRYQAAGWRVAVEDHPDCYPVLILSHPASGPAAPAVGEAEVAPKKRRRGRGPTG